MGLTVFPLVKVLTMLPNLRSRRGLQASTRVVRTKHALCDQAIMNVIN